MHANSTSIGSFIKTVPCGTGSGVAAGTGDNTAITGAAINRLGYSSVQFAIVAKAVLAATKTLSIAAAYQESADGSSWDTAVTLQAATVALTGGDGGTTEMGVVKFDLSLANKKQYIRFNFTPDLSATGTDTFQVGAVAVLGGADKLPAA